jgi:flagellar protein FliS
MTAYHSNSAQMCYNNADLYGTTVEHTNQHGLVMLLFNGLVKNIYNALHAVKSGNIQVKSKAINKSLDILDELRSRLNFEVGGELALNLDGLYEYMQRRLLEANRDIDADALSEVASLIDEIKGVWVSIPESERN